MGTERRIRLLRAGRNQVLRIPRQFELSGNEAVLRKEGERLIIEQARPPSLLAVLAKLEPLEDDFPPTTDPPAGGVDL